MKQKFKVSCIIIPLFFITGCYENQSTSKTPVKLFSYYQAPANLPDNIKKENISDLKKILTEKWEGNINVIDINTPEKLIQISSCEEYFKYSHQNLETRPLSYYKIFVRDTVLCEATRIIANGKPSSKTYLDSIVFDKHLPEKLPKQMAQIISTMESKRILANNNISTWAQVEPVTRTEKKGPYHLIYYNEGGSERLQLLAKGDFNQDGIEDMLIQINDAVEGGTYSATRLFLLTRLKPNGKIKLLNEWPKEPN